MKKKNKKQKIYKLVDKGNSNIDIEEYDIDGKFDGYYVFNNNKYFVIFSAMDKYLENNVIYSLDKEKLLAIYNERGE